MTTIRDHHFDITPAEFALGSLYGTSGNWGQDVWLTDVAVAEILGVKRQTVSGWRKSLLAKGLIEVTGKHPTQPNAWRLRLTLPAELPKPHKDESRGGVRSTDSQLVVGSPLNGHPMSVQGTPDVRSTDRGMSVQRTQQLEQDIEQDIDIINTTPDGGGQLRFDDQDQDQDQAPAGPCPPGAGDISPADGEAVEPDWTGDGENVPGNRAWLAGELGVPAGSIGAPLWRWLESLGLDIEVDYDGVTDAAQKASGARTSRVGYFQKILPGILARHRDDRAGVAGTERHAAGATRAALPAGEAGSGRALREHTLQGDPQGPNRDSNGDAVGWDGQDQTQPCPAGTGPSAHEPCPAGTGPSAHEPGPAGPLAADPLPGPSADVPSVPGPSERMSAWLGTLPGTARRDAEHQISVSFPHYTRTPAVPASVPGRSVGRYLSVAEAEAAQDGPRLPAPVRDYLARQARLQASLDRFKADAA
ncbi:MAG TPA: hypothetical protein VFO01_11470 [Trebonia sp.]|nr:hypothetical protein [Trebonia sp.]